MFLNVLQLCIVAAAVIAQSNVTNDNYCDLADGSDEPNTPACSHLKTLFTCNPGDNSYTIFSSKVHDGVCDCCDGSDEVNSPFKPHCPNTCEQELAAQKRAALTWYRTVQAALQTKADQVLALKRQKLKENKSYETLKSEKKELEQMLITMKFLLSKEVKREYELRWRLLRDRENHCASGHDAACNYFYSEWYYDDELQGEGYPVELLGPQKKLPYEYTHKEQEYMNKLGTVERVRWSICPVKTLLPDDDARLFGKIGEYLNYMATPGAKISQDRNILVVRRHTIFGPFLEYGEKGYILAGVVASETLGLVLSPLVGVGYAVTYGYRQAASRVWNWVKEFSRYRGIATPTKVMPADSTIQLLANLIIESDIPGSTVDNALSYLDYNRYSLVSYVVDGALSYLNIPLWVYEIAVRSPMMYYDYYFNQKYMALPPRRQACMLRNAINNTEKELMHLQELITAEEELRDALVAVKENSNDKNKRSGRSDKRKKDGSIGGTSKPKAKLIKMDYGVDGSFEVLKDVCLEKRVDEYDYKFCFFDEVKQGKYTSMGVFSNWGTSKTAASPAGIDFEELYNNPGEALSNIANQLLEAVADPATGAQYLQTTSEWIASQTNSLLTSTQNMIQSLANGTTISGDAKLHGNGTRMLDELDRFYTYQWYEGGTACQTKPGKERNTLVELRCDVKNDIVEVSELETCAYKLIVSTPIVCTKRTEERSLAELDKLGVFGFTTKK